MCFSPIASFTAAAVLLPSGIFGVQRARRTDSRYVAVCALPLLFGLQQFLEGLVWIFGAKGDYELVRFFSLAYMFFTWIVWPIWVPVSLYFSEPDPRKPLYMAFAIVGSMLGAVLYIPYFAHEGWLITRFLPNAIQYGGVELLDFLIPREATNLIYVMIVISPIFFASDRELRIFGVLIFAALVVTYFFFFVAYVSAFCFGAAAMSLYLTYMIFRKGMQQPIKQ